MVHGDHVSESRAKFLRIIQKKETTYLVSGCRRKSNFILKGIYGNEIGITGFELRVAGCGFWVQDCGKLIAKSSKLSAERRAGFTHHAKSLFFKMPVKCKGLFNLVMPHGDKADTIHKAYLSSPKAQPESIGEIME